MVKKFTTLIAVFAFASSASVAFACNTNSGCKDGKDKGEAVETSAFVVAGSGCGGGSCGGDKNDS